MDHLDATTIAVYRFIEAHWRQHGFAPSLRELAAECHLSVAGVLLHLDKLEMSAYVAREPGAARTLHILKPLPASLVTTTEAIYRFIVERVTADEAPTQEEMAAAFHLSTQTVRVHLKRLEQAGLIQWQKRVSRSILLLKK